MCDARCRARAFGRLLAFELSRYPSPFRLLLASVSLVSMLLLARDNFFQQMAIASMSMAEGSSDSYIGLTAFDMLYLAFNNQLIAGVVLPLTCGMLCADLIARDRINDMRMLIACENRSAIAYITAKLAVSAVVCFLLVLLFSVACVAISRFLMGLPFAAEAPAWLSSTGPADSIWGSYGPVPIGWNYTVLIISLVVCFSILESVLGWSAMALCSVLRNPGAAPILIAACSVIVAQIESLIPSLGLLLDIKPFTTTIGWITDRLCLVNYRFGASFFQGSAGGAYQGFVAVSSEVAAHEYPINSWASLVLMGGALACLSVTWLLVLERCAGAFSRCDKGEPNYLMGYQRRVHERRRGKKGGDGDECF